MECHRSHGASREARFVRRNIIDALRLAGGLYLCRQQYTQREYNSGVVEHCPYCWDEILKQSNNSRCPHCFGSGFANNGYKPAFVVRAHVTENSREMQNKHETQGIRETQDMTIKLPFEPQFNSGDVFAEIVEMKHGVPYKIGRCFQINGDVTWKTVQGEVSNQHLDNIMVLRDRIVSQEATVKLLLETDDKYLQSDEFWGMDSSYNPDMSNYQGEPSIENLNYDDMRHAHGWTV